MISVLVCVQEGAGVWLLEVIPLMCILIAHRGILFFFVLRSSQGAPLRGCSGRGLDWGQHLLFTGVAGSVVCLLKWKGTFFCCCSHP